MKRFLLVWLNFYFGLNVVAQTIPINLPTAEENKVLRLVSEISEVKKWSKFLEKETQNKRHAKNLDYLLSGRSRQRILRVLRSKCR